MNTGTTQYAKRGELSSNMASSYFVFKRQNKSRLISVLLFLFLIQGVSHAQIVSWSNANSTTSANMPVASINANLNSSTKVSYNGLVASSTSPRWSFKGWDASSLTKNFVLIEVYPNAGLILNLNSSVIAISAGSSNSGPNSFTLYASTDGGYNYSALSTVSSACSGQSGLLNYTLPSSGYNSLSSILFKLVASTTACSGGVISALGTGGFDQITLTGSISAAPPTAFSSNSFSPQAFPTTGGYSPSTDPGGSGWDISWTIGQPFDTTLIANGITLTEGVQQIDAPRILSFNPTTASSYDTVLIKGTAFTGATFVSFGDTASLYFKVIDDSTIKAVVGNGASGNVRVSNTAGTVYFGGFTYNNLPTISSVTPLSGPVGTLVTFTGTNLFDTTVIKIGGVNAIRISNTRTSLVAMVMPGATTGSTSLTNGGNTATSSSFTVIATPFPVSQQGNKLIGTGGSVDGQQGQGYAVALSADGNTAIVGGNIDSNFIGAAWIYTRLGNTWTQQGSILMPPVLDQTSPGFGTSVSISADGNTAIIGGANDHSSLGAAWIFTRDLISNTWSYQSKLVGSGSVGSTVYQGISVGISGDGNTAIVGGYYDNNGKGAAWTFSRSGNTWTQNGNKLVGSSSSSDAQLGYSVAISADGKTVAVGGNQDNAGQGAVWIYRKNGSAWSQQNKLADNTSLNSNQGSAVALSADGNTVIFGGPFDNNQVGASWIYKYSGSAWSQSAKLIGKNATGLSQQGYGVALSADGNTAMIGGAYDNNGIGAGWVFTKSGSTWVQQVSKMKGNPLVGNSYFGSSVAISAEGRTGFAGANNDNNGLGAAWAFVSSPIPSISSFDPDSAVAGSVITIKGTNFTGVNAVTIGGVPAKSFSISVINGDTTILATLGAGASGFVKVTNAYGTDSAAGFVLLTCATVYSSTTKTICADALPYSWNNKICTAAGTYTAVLKAASGCDSIVTLTLTVNALPIPAINNNTTGCASVTLVASGGKSYLWNGGSDIVNATNTFTKTGTYTVTVIDANNCSATTTTIVTVNPLPTPQIVGETKGCDSVKLVASGGNAYNWSGGKYSNSATNIFTTSGTYTVTVTDTATGCSATASQTDIVNVRPTATITGATTACDSVKLTAQGAGINGSYNWNAGNSVLSAINTFNKSGTYSVTITDANGCTSSATKTVVVNRLTGISVTENDTACSSVTLTASGGVAYTWSGGNSPTSATNTFTNSGRFAVVVKDVNGCTAKDSAFVLVNKPPTLSLTQGSDGCGKIYLTAVTDSGTIAFNWNNTGSDPTSKTNTFTTNGTYSVIVTNTTTGCFSTASKAITVGTLHSISLDNVAATSCLGTSVLLVNGANSASKAFVYKDTSYYYTLLGQTYLKDSSILVHKDSTLSGDLTTTNYKPTSAAGYYAIAYFSDGCKAQSPVTKVNIAKIGITGLTTGCQSVTLTATGGKSYTWNTGLTPSAATNTFNTLGSQTVSVTGTDSNFCVGTASQSIVIQNLPPPSASIIGNSTGCDSVILTATGGSSYSWYGEKTSSLASNTFYQSGIDSVKVTAANGCSVLLTKSVQINPHPDAFIPGFQSVCGMVTLTASGGASYLWNTGNDVNAATNTFTQAGNNIPVSVVVSDNTGCKTVLYDTITVNANPNLVVSGNNISCDSVTLLASGGDSYYWTGGKYTNAAKNVFNESGTYQVTANNNNGCSVSQSITVSLNPQSPQLSIIASDSVLCGSKSVTFTATPVLGGTAPSYQWQKGGISINGATNATYSYTPSNGDVISCMLTSNNACLSVPTAKSNSISIKVASSVTPSISVAATATTICSGTAVTFTANAINGGTVPYFQWKKNGVNVGANAATYTDPTMNNKDSVWCVLTTNADCSTAKNATSNKLTLSVTSSVLPSIGIVASSTNICSGTTVSFTATASNGGTTPTYQWKKNGINVGTNSSSYTDANLSNNDSVLCVLTSNATCAIANSSSSNTLPIRVNNLPALFGNALSFDGIDDYVSIPNNTVYNTSKVTIETWVNWTATDNSSVQFLTSKANEVLEIHTGGGAGANGLRFIPTPGVYIDVPNVLPLNTWTHVAFVYDPSNASAKVYTNGINAPYTVSAGSLSTPLTSSSSNIIVGKRADGSYPLNGKIDELRIWNAALSQAQIQARMNTELSGSESSLVAYYNFNQGAAASNNSSLVRLIDYSSTNNNGVLNNFLLNGAVSNFVSGNNVGLLPIGGSSSLCSGGTSQLTDNTLGGIWNSVSPSIATINSTGLASGLTTGSSSITYTLVTGAGCTSSVNKTVSVNNKVTPSVSIAANPSGSICSGTSVTFTATPTNGGSTPTYQWTKGGVNISGATAATYTYAPSNNDVIACVLTPNNACQTSNSVTSNSITETVVSKIAPSITIAANPSGSICAGTSVTFTATPTNGGSTPTYQWTKGGVNISGATTATYTYSPSNNDVIACVLTANNTCQTTSTATSNSITAAVTSKVSPSITIAANPSSSICAGTSVTFTATPTNGGSTPTYQWTKGGLNISGATAATYVYPPSNNDVIACVLTANNTCQTTSTATSNSITAAVTAKVTPSITISANPSGSICAGTSVTFTATPTNGGNSSTYQWTKGGVNISGATAATYSYAPSNNDVIACVLTPNNACQTSNSVTSNSISETVVSKITPSITIAANPSGSICSGTSVTFTATPTNGGTTPTYQWTKGGVNISGATAATYTYAPSNNDVIACVLTANNTCQTTSTATSTSITTAVTTKVSPSISIASSVSGSICAGTSVVFTATPINGGATPAFQWKKNGNAISGATANTYTTAALANNDVITCTLTSSVTCTVTNTATSNGIAITINGINNSWTGITNTNWSTGSNWCSGIVPANNADIIIPVVTSKNYPALVSNLTLSGNVTLNSGAFLSLNGNTLTISGTWNGTGYLRGSSTSSLVVSTATTPTIYFNSAANDSMLNSLTISGNGGAKLASSIGITNLLSLNAGNLNLNGNRLTLKSTSISSTALVGPVATGASITGNITVERYIPKGYKGFRELSAGGVYNAGSIFNNWQEGGKATSGYGLFITGKTNITAGIDATSGLDYTTAGNLNAFNYLNYNTWTAITNPRNTNIDPYTGYHLAIYGDRTTNLYQNKFDTSNKMVNSTTIRTTGQLVTGTVTYTSTGVQGNYNSSVSKILPLKDTGSFIANPYPCIIDWESLSSTGLTSSYYYFEPTFLTASGYQTFVSYNATTHTNSIPVSSKVNRYIQPGQSFWVQTNSVANATRQLVISENNKVISPTNLTAVFGVAKPFDKLSVSLWRDVYGRGNTVVDGTVAVFDNSFSYDYGNEDTRKMRNERENISINEPLAGELSIDGIPVPKEETSLVLNLANLLSNTTYQLRLDGSYLNSNTGLRAYLIDKYLNVTTPISNSGYTYTFATATDAGSISDRFSIVFKKVATTPIAVVPSEGQISVYPNPVKGKSVHVKLDNIAPGNYSISLFNVLGKEVYSKTINHSKSGQDYQFTLPATLSVGAYTMRVNKAREIVTKTTLIIQ